VVSFNLGLCSANVPSYACSCLRRHVSQTSALAGTMIRQPSIIHLATTVHDKTFSQARLELRCLR